MPRTFPPSAGYLAECQQELSLKLPLKRDVQQALKKIILRLSPRSWNKIFSAPDFDASVFLRRQKVEFDLFQAYAEQKGWLDFETGGELRSSFADATVNFALAMISSSEEYLRFYNDEPDGRPRVLPGLFVLGLGKLGGKDLNFSSDIDLIAYFDEQQLPVAEEHGMGYICTRIMQDLTSLLSDVTEHGFVWRVDWRLRPEASINPLAMTIDMAEEFYRYRSLPWHRLALCKARVIAGDLSMGNTFLDDLNNFIWVRNLDYRSFDELRFLKMQINEEHPGLEIQREQEHKITRKAAGFNLKLGRGGIREIEFIVNALQLVWGGRNKDLQISHTMTALQRLARHKLIETELAEQLRSAYVYFRTLENRLQMLENQQTHTLPNDRAEQNRLLELVAISWKELGQTLYQHRKVVSQEFDQMFALEGETTPDEKMPPWVSELDPFCLQIVTNWHEGFQAYGAPNTMATSLGELFQQLLQLIDRFGVDREVAIKNIDEFFQTLPPGGQYFRLMLAFPDLLEQTIPPLISSPLMTHLLRQSPHIVDAMIEHPQGLQHEALDQGLANIVSERSSEVQMNGLRRFINEQLYARYNGFFVGDLAFGPFTRSLTDLAERALETGIQMVCHEMGLKKVPLTVLGLGKLGMSCMAPASDLDLIYIASEKVSIDVANEFSNRMHTLMSAQMREGVVYEMDMRLRPSGASGPPTVSIKSFRDYHKTYARTWEHLALIPARIVAGDRRTGEQVMRHRKVILSRPRIIDQLLNDVSKMHGMLVDQREVDDEQTFAIKLRAGGLLQAEYLANAIILSELAAGNLKPTDFELMLEQTLQQPSYQALYDAIHFWRPLQCWERIFGLQEVSLDQVPSRYIKPMMSAVGIRSEKQFKKAIQQHSQAVVKIAESFFGRAPAIENIDDWPDEPVSWKKK